jgi:tartrate/fumarate subfamily iron-sulfur-dependent hydro-lyase alpha chain
MITKKQISEVVYNTIKSASCHISEDIAEAFCCAIEKETKENAKEGLEKTLKSMQLSKERGNLLCPDTGWPLFYFKVGNEADIEGGIMALEELCREMVGKATKNGYLRSTMKHPVTGYDPGNNVGENMPDFNYKFVEGKDLQITYVAKGGGSECFGGTRYRVIAFADGLEGIKKFVTDCFVASVRAGAVCPPSILGVGIGGTANVAAALAKEAACLRTVKSCHPETVFADLEKSLYESLNMLGAGIMGAGGNTSVFGVNVEYAYTHLAGIAVATSTNCMIARRATFKIYSDGTVKQKDTVDWFNGR